MPAAEWSTRLPARGRGRAARPARVPAAGRRAHAARAGARLLRIVGGDGVARTIEVTGVPLFAHAGEFVGAMAIFWEPEAP